MGANLYPEPIASVFVSAIMLQNAPSPMNPFSPDTEPYWCYEMAVAMYMVESW
jgi:hypothetical protein